jgi:hypothetical protein
MREFEIILFQTQNFSIKPEVEFEVEFGLRLNFTLNWNLYYV